MGWWQVEKFEARGYAATDASILGLMAEIGDAFEAGNSNWGYTTHSYQTYRSGLIITYYNSTSSVIGVNQGTKTFTISGDHTTEIATDHPVHIKGSTANDGGYYVVSVALNGSDTDVVVVEAIPDATVDGTMYFEGSAQVCTVASRQGSQYSCANENMYNGGGQIDDWLVTSFKPSSSTGYYAKIDNTNNPYSDTSYCDNAGAYRFVRMYLNGGSSDDDIIDFNGIMYLVIAEDYPAFVWFYVDGDYLSVPYIRGINVGIDDVAPGFTAMQEVGDTYKSFFGMIGGMTGSGPASETTTSLTSSTSHKLSTFDDSGNRIESFITVGRTSAMSYSFESSKADGYVREAFSLSRLYEKNYWNYGRKGVVNTDFVSLIRDDAAWNKILSTGTKYFLHIKYGLVVPWQSGVQPLK